MCIVSNGGYQRVNVDEHAHRTEIREDNIRNSSSNNVWTVRYQDVESVEILLLYDGDGIVPTMNWIKMSSVVLMHQISHCASVAKIKWPDSNSFTNAILEASRRTIISRCSDLLSRSRPKKVKYTSLRLVLRLVMMGALDRDTVAIFYYCLQPVCQFRERRQRYTNDDR